jgi:hypothetical protein
MHGRTCRRHGFAGFVLHLRIGLSGLKHSNLHLLATKTPPYLPLTLLVGSRGFSQSIALDSLLENLAMIGYSFKSLSKAK